MERQRTTPLPAPFNCPRTISFAHYPSNTKLPKLQMKILLKEGLVFDGRLVLLQYPFQSAIIQQVYSQVLLSKEFSPLLAGATCLSVFFMCCISIVLLLLQCYIVIVSCLSCAVFLLFCFFFSVTLSLCSVFHVLYFCCFASSLVSHCHCVVFFMCCISVVLLLLQCYIVILKKKQNNRNIRTTRQQYNT